MPIQTKCPGCGQAYSVSEKLAGKRTRCKQCGGVVTIPGGTAARQAPAAPAAAPTPPRPAPANRTPAPAGIQNAALFAGAKQTRGFRLPKPVGYAVGGVAALLLLGVVVGLVIQLSGGQEANLAGDAPQTEPPKGTRADALPALPPGQMPRVAIRVQSGEAHFSTTPSPCVVIDKQLWNLDQGKLCMNLKELIRFNQFSFAASPDGAKFAMFDLTSSTVEVWSVATGESLRVLEPENDRFNPLTIGFRGNDEIVVIWRDITSKPSQAISYNVATGKQTGLITVRLEKALISPSGNQFICSSVDGFRVGDFTAGSPTAKKLSAPTPNVFRPPSSLPIISPDGKYAFGCIRSLNPVFVLWDLGTGEAVYSRRAPKELSLPFANAIAWLSDSSAVLLDGRMLIDRDSSRLLWEIPDAGLRAQSASSVSRADEVFCTIEDRKHHEWLVSVAIPWDTINAATAAIHANGALFKPGQPVDLRIAVGGLFGGPEDTRGQIGEAVAKSLARTGIPIKAGAAMQLHVSLSERQGESMEVVEKSGFGIRSNQRRTGQIVQQSRGSVDVVLKQGATGAVAWRFHTSSSGGSVIYDDASGDPLRRQMLGRIVNRLAKMPVPYFVAADGKRLPVASQIKDARGQGPILVTSTGAAPAQAAAAKSQVAGLPPTQAVEIPSLPGIPSKAPEPDPYRLAVFSKNFEPKVAIPLPKQTLLFPDKNCDVVMCGGQVWDIRSGRQVADFTRAWKEHSSIPHGAALYDLCHLSPDGSFLTVSDQSYGLPLHVWSAKRGDVVHTFNGAISAQAFWGAFRNNVELVLLTEHWGKYGDSDIRILNVETGETVRNIPLQGVKNAREAQGALSPDGARLALAHNGVREIALSSDIGVPRYFDAPVDAFGRPVEVEGLAYSPGGDMLAGVTLEGDLFRLLVWNPQSGKIISDRLYVVGMDDTSHSRSKAYPGPLLRWLPDGSSLLLAGSALVDAASGRVVWVFSQTAELVAESQAVGVLDSRHLLVGVIDENVGNWLLNAPIPWESIRAGAQAANDAAAPLRPGGKVSIDLALGRLSATDEKGRNVVGEAVASRLAQDGLQIAANQPARFFVRLGGDTTKNMSASGTSRDDGAAKRLTLDIGWRRADGEFLWRRRKRDVYVDFSDTSPGVGGVSGWIRPMLTWMERSPWPYVLGGDALKGAGVLPVISEAPTSLDGIEISREPRGLGQVKAVAAHAATLNLPALPNVTARQAAAGATGVAASKQPQTATSDPYAAQRAKIELQPWERLALSPDGPQPKVALEFKSIGDELGFSFTASRYALVGRRVYDLVAGSQLGELKGQNDLHSNWVAVSADGKLVASQNSPKRGTIDIWSVETGEIAREIAAGNTRATLKWMGFRNATELVLVWSPWLGNDDGACQIWNASTGAGVLAFGPERGSKGFGEGEFTLSADGSKLVYQDRASAHFGHFGLARQGDL